MPTVKGRKFPYSKKGKIAAKKAMTKSAPKAKKKKKV